MSGAEGCRIRTPTALAGRNAQRQVVYNATSTSVICRAIYIYRAISHCYMNGRRSRPHLSRNPRHKLSEDSTILRDRIGAHFDAHPNLKAEPRFIGLFQRTRGTKRSAKDAELDQENARPASAVWPPPATDSLPPSSRNSPSSPFRPTLSLPVTSPPNTHEVEPVASLTSPPRDPSQRPQLHSNATYSPVHYPYSSFKHHSPACPTSISLQNFAHSYPTTSSSSTYSSLNFGYNHPSTSSSSTYFSNNNSQQPLI